MQRNLFIMVFFMWAIFVTPAYANVFINEIAWMGTDVSSTNEWIELYNDDSSAVDLTGWTIEAEDGSPSIALSGVISANGYFLIERTDDTTVPSVPADLIAVFGNGLSNTGETLRLQNQSATVIDKVIGGEDWVNIGGDNATKETAQRTVNSWVTGAPSPRMQNAAQAGEVLGSSADTLATANTSTTGSAVVQTNTTTSTANSPVKPATQTEVFPRKDIVVFAGDDKRAFAFFPTTFTGVATGLYGESLDTATYRWNFGDGTTGEGKTLPHTYEFGGEYLATLEVFWSNYHRTDRLSVMVTVPDVIIAKTVSGENGYIELTNRTDREIDLSGWTIALSEGEAIFTFPSNTIILSKKSFLLSNRVSHIVNGEAGLMLNFPDGGIVFRTNVTSSTQVNEMVKNPVASNSPSTKKIYQGVNFAGAVGANSAREVNDMASTTGIVLWEKDTAQLGAGIASRGYEIDGSAKWLYVLLTIMLIVFAGFMIARSHRDEVTVADEYAIIEDIIEGRDDLK